MTIEIEYKKKTLYSNGHTEWADNLLFKLMIKILTLPGHIVDLIFIYCLKKNLHWKNLATI